MLLSIWTKLKTILERSPQTSLEQFIISKNPTTPGEVEYWAKRFIDQNYSSTRYLDKPYY